MQPTLLILAAGMASRYGSMKQMEGFGPSGETIMDYSIYDAIRSGFGKVVFIIRKNFAGDFRQVFEPRWGNKIKLEYVYQELDLFINDYTVPEGRTKPWGTAHAVLCAKNAIREPFAVINADDFYGSDSFKQAARFLSSDCSEKLYSIIGYELLKTLSENGTVNRGVCQLDKNGNLSSVTERLNIAMKNGKVVCDDEHEPKELPSNTSVSMNFWCFHPSLFAFSEKIFEEFLAENISKPKSEFFIPIVADRFIREGGGTIRVIPTSAQWFGVTYKEDAPEVRQGLIKLVRAGEYPGSLWT